jgi:tetratricopeptide (TPR) repeat protein
MADTKTPPTTLDRIEQLSKIVAALLIPIVLAWMGFRIEERISEKSLDRDYVQIALGILAADSATAAPPLRVWAVDLLNESAPTKLTEEAARQLKSGQATLPSPRQAYDLIAQGRADEAIAAFDQLAKADNRNPATYYNRATAHINRGDLARAVADLDTVITLSPNHARAYNNRGRAKIDLGRVAEGCRDLRRAVQLGEQNAPGNVERFCQGQ